MNEEKDKGLITHDMSQVEIRMLQEKPAEAIDMDTHLSLVTGLERQTIKALRYSEVYGSTDTRDELIQKHGKAYAIKTTLDFLAAFPAATQNMRFRKERSRLMLRALVEKLANRRNTQVVYDGECFSFSHKGSLLLSWDVSRDEITNINAGEFEEAPSTLTQRTLAREAIHEFRKAVLWV